MHPTSTSTSSKVWCVPISQNGVQTVVPNPQNGVQTVVNLNQTAVHSENPLKHAEIKSTVYPLGSSTDFLLSGNLYSLINFSKILDCSKNESTDGKILQPRQTASDQPSETHQITDPDCTKTYHPTEETPTTHTGGPQEVVPLKNVPAVSEYTLLETPIKNKPVKPHCLQPRGQQNGLFELLDTFGIDYREETVVSHTLVVEEKRNPEFYIQGKIIFGGRQSLEKLAKDMNKLKTGTHGVITNPKYDFLWNPRCTLKKKKILGRGGNGTVELCGYNNMEFVTKTIFRDFRPNEVLFTNSLSHEYIVKSHGLIIRNGSPQIIMDYAGDNLLHYGLSRNIAECEIWNITYQILEALNYLHSKQIRHFDVKPENIVLMEDSNGHKTLKLADFGGASLFTEDVDCLSWTPAYMSPEMDQFYLNRQFPRKQLITTSCGEVTEKCDVYSLALSILFLYVKGHVLIKHITKGMQAMVGPEKADAVSMKIVIMNAQNPGMAESLIPFTVGKEMKSVLSGMLKGNVDERLTAKHAMDLMKELSSKTDVAEEPKMIMRRKSKSTENRRHSQTMKTPKLVVVTLDNNGNKVSEYKNPNVTTQGSQTPITQRPHYRNNDLQTLPFGSTLETEEQQRPLRDLNIDLQLKIIMEQINSVKDERMRQVIDEENRPLLKRLVKRKLKDKVSGEIAFKMTKLRDELDSSSTCSNDSGKENMSSPTCEPEIVQPIVGPGNMPNFDMFLDF